MKTEHREHSEFMANRREVAVRVQGVSRYFDNPRFVRALSTVSFDVYRGEVFGLLGPRDSGKSTAMRVLAGRLSPSEGNARVFGRSPRRRAGRARIGYLPQQAIHARSQFVAGAIAFLGRLFRRQKRGARGPEAAGETAGKERLAALKQILIRKPRLVLLDEPFTGLDLGGCDEMRRLIRTLAPEGGTVILSSSSRAFAKEECDRLGVLYRGRLEGIGTLEELLATTAGLRYLVELLPQATAERVLQIIRQDVGTSDSPAQTAVEAPEVKPPGGTLEAAAAAAASPQAAADAVLAPLLKAAATDPGRATERVPTVNHEMLATLTRSAADEPAPLLGAKPELPVTPVKPVEELRQKAAPEANPR
jgi:ABC-2 type transport system ATP-binding protein